MKSRFFIIIACLMAVATPTVACWDEDEED